MAVAKARLVSKQTMREAATTVGTSPGRVAQASVILQHAPELAEEVMAGVTRFDDAYTEAKARKGVSETRQTDAERAAQDLAQLRRDASDLADLVAEERLTLAEALASWRKREAGAFHNCGNTRPDQTPRSPSGATVGPADGR